MNNAKRYNATCIKSTGRLPVTNLPSCGKVVPDKFGDGAQSLRTRATKAGSRPSLLRAVFVSSPIYSTTCRAIHKCC